MSSPRRLFVLMSVLRSWKHSKVEINFCRREPQNRQLHIEVTHVYVSITQQLHGMKHSVKINLSKIASIGSGLLCMARGNSTLDPRP
jgi:hypothetical protein